MTILHALPGRLRLHLSVWPSEEREAIEATIGRGRGISSVRANALTGNILVHYDTAVTDEAAVLETIRAALASARHDPGATAGLPLEGSRKPELMVSGDEQLPDPLRVFMPALHLAYSDSPVGIAMHVGEAGWYMAGGRDRRKVVVPVLHLLFHATPVGLALHLGELTWALAPFMLSPLFARSATSSAPGPLKHGWDHFETQ